MPSVTSIWRTAIEHHKHKTNARHDTKAKLYEAKHTLQVYTFWKYYSHVDYHRLNIQNNNVLMKLSKMWFGENQNETKIKKKK